ncbi:hypothetical protein EC973_003502 [Apophysomyces ossiformis]|uniref:N-acetyltransferase domain-containing protein n=1 Tax=Apophysomyces ossiformis TaxID=679940 RepID=A0A8H7BMI1_9FUNG|nr:hypothetical protein EC973_003502 [Apophysomyces ossiformis]
MTEATATTTTPWYTIRGATENDLPTIAEIYNERVRNSSSLFVYETVSLENRKAWYQDMKAKGYPIVVVVETATGRVAAYGCLGAFRPHPAYVLTTEISLYVHLDFHRRGLGRVMLKELIQIGRDMGLRSIIACITSENEPSIRLFSTSNFKFAGTFHDVGYKFGRYLSVSFYELILETVLDESVLVPKFKPFPWSEYKFGH